ncbi:MAG: T9SS type A sorting domain-containing protein [Bacteroidetes bacterium]|nr:T9SS type A sorting domain-containing protein [Bacteroidota bacterium]
MTKNKNEKKSLCVFPNPVSEKVELKSGEEIKNVELFNSVGEKIKSIQPINNSITIDCSGLNAGIYILKINSAGENFYRKIVKQ